MKWILFLTVCLLPLLFTIGQSQAVLPGLPLLCADDQASAGDYLCQLLVARNQLLDQEITLIQMQGHKLELYLEQTLAGYKREIEDFNKTIEQSKKLIDDLRAATDRTEREDIAMQFVTEITRIRLSQLWIIMKLIDLDEELNQMCLDWSRFSIPSKPTRPGLKIAFQLSFFIFNFRLDFFGEAVIIEGYTKKE